MPWGPTFVTHKGKVLTAALLIRMRAVYISCTYGSCVLRYTSPRFKNNRGKLKTQPKGIRAEGWDSPFEPITVETPELGWSLSFSCWKDNTEVFLCKRSSSCLSLRCAGGKLKIGRLHLWASCLFTACGTTSASPLSPLSVLFASL